MELSYYRRGSTPIFASAADPRFSSCAYVPRSYDHERPLPVAVLMHSTDRDAQYVRDEFADFAEAEGCLLFAPIFPAGIGDPDDVDNYKFLRYGDIRFDLALLQMLDELAGIYRVDTERVLLTGFSGGAHFTHRFLYAHPKRVRAASIAAPGIVTLLDDHLPWPAGVGGMDAALGLAADVDAIRAVPVQLIIGDADRETWEIAVGRGYPAWIDGVNDETTDRIARLRALRESLEAHGLRVRVDTVPSVAHEGRPLAPPTKDFFAAILRGSADAH